MSKLQQAIEWRAKIFGDNTRAVENVAESEWPGGTKVKYFTRDNVSMLRTGTISSFCDRYSGEAAYPFFAVRDDKTHYYIPVRVEDVEKL